jgi:hypothetical protein
VNVATLDKYKQIPIYKAFIDYYINNIDLQNSEFRKFLDE